MSHHFLLRLFRPFSTPRVPAPAHPSMWLGAEPERAAALRLATSLPIVDMPERYEHGWNGDRLAAPA